jgi:hypothetical protein
MLTDDAVAQFVSLTGAGPEEAQQYMEMTGGDLQQAVNLFLDGGGAPAAPSPVPVQRREVQRSDVVDPEVAAEVAAVAAAAGISDDAHMSEEVRAPMPAFQDQIIQPDMERRMQEAIDADSAAMSQRMTFDRMDVDGSVGRPNDAGSAINQLFAPPSFNDARTWYEVLSQGKQQQKWILVNIQQAEVFASHQLNRDVWSDDTIKDIIAGSFLFWQRDDKSTEGDQFCSYYNCGHQLPHICVVDPNTGRRTKGWDGRKWVESHAAAEYLFGFLDGHALSSSPSLAPKPSPTVPAMPASDMQLSGLPDETADVPDQVMDTAPAEPIAAMPEEPSEDVENLKVSLRLPSGKRITRRFRPSDAVDVMFDVASALVEEPVSKIELATQFPKRSLRDIEGGLQVPLRDAQVANNAILVSVRS